MRRGNTALVNVQTQGQYRRGWRFERSIRIRWRERDESHGGRVWREIGRLDGNSTFLRPVTKLGNRYLYRKSQHGAIGNESDIERERIPVEWFGL